MKQLLSFYGAKKIINKKLMICLLALLASFMWESSAQSSNEGDITDPEFMQYYDFEKDGIYYYIPYNKENEVTVVSDRDFYVNREGWYAMESAYYSLHMYETDVYAGDVIIPEKVEYNGKEYTVTSIIYQAMSFCRNLKNVTIPESITEIMDAAFYGCPKLEQLVIPSVDVISATVFAECPNLKFVDLSRVKCGIDDDYLTWTGQGCSSLQRIILPLTGKYIGFETLPSGCEIICLNPEPVLELLDAHDESIYSRCTLYVPEESLDIYRQHPVYNQFKTILGLNSGVNSTIATPDIAVVNNTVSTQNGANIYSTTGSTLAKLQPGESKTLDPGMYLVRSDKGTRKIIIHQ